jgi:hypothetical protein
MTFSYTPSATTWPARAATGIATSNGWKERHPGDHVVRPRLRPGTVRLLPARDCAAVFFKEWVAHQNSPLEYSNGTTWDRMLQKGILLLERFAPDDRVRIRQPRRNLHIKSTRSLSKRKDFGRLHRRRPTPSDSEKTLPRTGREFPCELAKILGTSPQITAPCGCRGGNPSFFVARPICILQDGGVGGLGTTVIPPQASRSRRSPHRGRTEPNRRE